MLVVVMKIRQLTMMLMLITMMVHVSTRCMVVWMIQLVTMMQMLVQTLMTDLV
jgi:hypothetical protein